MSSSRRDPYDVIGVSRDADADEIKRAFRQRAMQYHPDRNPGDEAAEERFKEISEAYALLRDPETRARYDRYGHATSGQTATPTYTSEQWREMFNEAEIPIDWTRMTAGGGTGNVMFDALFGMVTGMLRGSGLLPGETREVLLELSLGEAGQGATKRVRVPGPSVCAVCHGTGRVVTEGATATGPTGPFSANTYDGSCPSCNGRGVRRNAAAVEVTVPAGAKNNTKLRLRGLGGPGSPPGDLMVDIEVRLPDTARVQGRDVHDTIAIAPWQAAAGGDVWYEGVRVPIPPGASDGQSVVVKGAGLGGGDLHLTLTVDLVGGILRSARTWLDRLASGGKV